MFTEEEMLASDQAWKRQQQADADNFFAEGRRECRQIDEMEALKDQLRWASLTPLEQEQEKARKAQDWREFLLACDESLKAHVSSRDSLRWRALT
jgi:gluconate kinase